MGASLSRQKVQGEHGVVQIETRTLDSYALDNVGFIKIDVEGYEHTVPLRHVVTMSIIFCFCQSDLLYKGSFKA